MQDRARNLSGNTLVYDIGQRDTISTSIIRLSTLCFSFCTCQSKHQLFRPVWDNGRVPDLVGIPPLQVIWHLDIERQ